MVNSSTKGRNINSRSSRRESTLVVAGGILVAIILAGTFSWLYLDHQFSTPKDLEAGEQLFVVSGGESVSQIASNLEAEGIIRDDLPFLLYWKLKPQNITEKFRKVPRLLVPQGSASIKAGKYLLSPSMTIPQVSEVLVAGKTVTNTATVTIPEGFNVYEIDQRLTSEGLIEKGELIQFAKKHRVDLTCDPPDELKNCSAKLTQSNPRSSASTNGNNSSLNRRKSASTLEGFLFPDTYEFNKGASVEAIVERLLTNFERKINPLIGDLSVRSPKGDVNRCESVDCLLTVASIVEKEARDFEEKRTVAGVIYNRLERDMKLDSCPTVIYAQLLAASNPYAFIQTRREHNPVSIMDTEIDSPYNTYQLKGLPPTPVANPGLDALRAALDPADTDYIYYLSNPTGETFFSETHEEHLRKKDRYLR